MIPKIIHYCWFGNSLMPEEQFEYIQNWKKLMPKYEYKLWNESNFDINSSIFTQEVAKAKKWGYIVDYVRAYVVYNYGGIYLDTDVELLKPLDNLLENKCFSGFRRELNNEYYIAPGLIFGGEKRCLISKELLHFYSNTSFIDKQGNEIDASPIIFTNLIKKHGLKQNNIKQELDCFTAYPSEYFDPLPLDGILNITENTYSIHHNAASWFSWKQKLKHKILKYKMGRKLVNTILEIRHGEGYE
jgi:hypothetical protein